MTSEPPPPVGAFAEALIDAAHIRAFLEERVRPLKEEEEALAKPWRPGFRVKLPYYGLLDGRQQEHLRGIFAHLLPDTDIAVDRFDREELILLDVLSETYITQSRIFVELMEQHDYRVVPSARRDVPGRIIALTLSASVFIFDAPDEHRKRQYRYQNIYGNRHVEPDGRCRLKGHLRLAHVMRALEFRTSPLLLLAVHPEGVAYRMEFLHESQVVSDTFTSRMEEVSFSASSSFHSYTDVRSISEVEAEAEGEDEEDDEDDFDPDGGSSQGHDTGR